MGNNSASRTTDGLIGLDAEVLVQAEEDPGLADTLMQDGGFKKKVVDAVISKLQTDFEYAQRLCGIFKLDYFILISANQQAGIEFEKVTWRMLKTDIAGIQPLLSVWKIPLDTLKFFTLKYLFQKGNSPNPVIWAEIMEATKLSGGDIKGYCDEQRRKALIEQQMRDSGAKALSAAEIAIPAEA